MRRYSSTRLGSGFDDWTIEQVWQKGQMVPGRDPRHFRKDTCGALMTRYEYGNVDSLYGWEIDHNLPVAHGGGDDLSNLQPLQWQNNRHKSDDLRWSCAVTFR